MGGEPAELLASGQITLKHFQNSFALTFNVPDHALADVVESSYRLTVAGDEWYTMDSYGGDTGDCRSLAPVSYVLEVRARGGDQPGADDIESLDIHIRPPLWLSWWAKTLYVVAALAVLIVILGFYKRKLDLENKLVLEKNDHERKQELYDERMRFFTNITHELRSPLTLIVGPLEDIQEDGTTPPKFAARIGLIYKSANRLLELINQILEFRKTETQNKKLSIMKADLGDIVRECVLKESELNMKPRVNVSGGIESGDTVFNFDKGAVTMMIDNLLSNSVKFTSEGDITVTLRDRQGDGGGYAEIEVRDTGCGIAAGEVDKIFERYYQAGTSDKVGTGIGLARGSNLGALHGGTINADSRPGE